MGREVKRVPLTTKSAADDADLLARMLPVLRLGPGASALCATLAPHHMIHGIRRAGFELEKETDSSWIYRNTEAPNRGHLAWAPKHREYLDYGSAVAKVVRDVAEARGWSQAEALLYFLRIAAADHAATERACAAVCGMCANPSEWWEATLDCYDIFDPKEKIHYVHAPRNAGGRRGKLICDAAAIREAAEKAKAQP